MNKEQMRASHEVQIQAILDEDWVAVHKLFNEEVPISSAYDTWNRTGGFDYSIFSRLPSSPECKIQTCGCPVQIKFSISSDWHYTPLSNRFWYEKLGLRDNDLIPTSVDRGYRFTWEQLQEFSCIQLEARYN